VRTGAGAAASAPILIHVLVTQRSRMDLGPSQPGTNSR
jgi:hypothetical protein